MRYGQVIKQRAGRRLVSVIRRVAFGVAELIPPGANLDLAFGTTQREDSAACRATASQDAQFRQAPDGSRYANTALQELLQYVPETRHIEGEDASASRWTERPLLDTQRTANLQCCYHFKDHVGSTD